MKARRFVALCLRPWARRIEGQMAVALLSPETRKSLYLEHDLSGAEQASEAKRYGAYSTGRNNGWLSVNDIRRRENLPRIEGGNEYLKPLNMVASDAPSVDGGKPRAAEEAGGPSGAAGENTRH
jgi:phage portal protein BeeE